MAVTEKYVIRNDNRRLSKVTTSPKKTLSRQSCINNMALKLLQYLYCWWRSCLVVIYKFYLLSIRLHSATNIRKHPFLYPQGESLRINFDHIYHQRSPSQLHSTKPEFRFKSCSRCIGDSQWWRSLTMVPAGNIAKHLSPVNRNTETIIIIKSV